jgi:carbon monoxide dehydrogenase subunit G
VRLENSFEVPAPPEQVWDFLLDVSGVVPCMPGAELTEIVDDRTWKGKVSVRLGAVSLSYLGTVVMEERDERGRTVVLEAKGTEARGKGMASARSTSRLEPTGNGGTRVVIETDLTLAGAVAQFGRGMIADVSQRLTDEFADCLKDRLTSGAEEAVPASAGRPVAGLRLGAWALIRALGRFFSRLWRAVTVPFRR